jgi:TRAP-type C4-dicarboxylate transport system permease small subunit
VDKKYRSIIGATFSLLIIGTIIFHFLEGWRWFDAFYFCVITLATVGYGDFVPKTDLGKIAAMIYIFSGIGIFLAFVQAYFDFIKERRKNKK